MDSSEREEKLLRNLGFWGIWLLVINGLIGSGIFGLPGAAARLAGDFSPLIYVLCALLILPVLLSFAELSSYFRGTGGPIRYVTDAYGPFAGFQIGWLHYASRVVGFAANSVLLVDSVGYFWPNIQHGLPRLVVMAGLYGGMFTVNIIGSSRAMQSLGLVTVAKFMALLLVVVAGVAVLGGRVLEPLAHMSPRGARVGSAMLLLIYAYVGWESAVVPAGEARNPARDMPRSLLAGLLTACVLYLLVQTVCMAVLPDLATSRTPLVDAAAVLLGQGGATLLMIGAICSIGGNLLAAGFAAPRMTYALALGGHLPSWFKQVHPRFLTPSNSIVFYGVAAFILAALGSFVWLAASVVFLRLVLYIVTCSTVPRLRRRHAAPGRFVLPLGYTIPMLGIVACGWLLLHVKAASFALGGLVVAVGWVLYGIARWIRPRRPGAESARAQSGSGSDRPQPPA